MPPDAFDVLILIARPAAGKSEVIDYLQSTPMKERARRFHVGPFQVIDDFPMLWAWFEEDDILEHIFDRPRLHSTSEHNFKDDVLWHVLMERISLEYTKLVRDAPDYHRANTALIEFSRGGGSGGYRKAFQHLSDDLLRRAAVMYVEVTFEDSMRKNRRRFNPDRPGSILEHGLPDHKIERIYKEDDFADFSAADPRWLAVRDIRVPYVVFENHDDVTTDQPEQLGRRLEERLGALWELYTSR